MIKKLLFCFLLWSCCCTAANAQQQYEYIDTSLIETPPGEDNQYTEPAATSADTGVYVREVSVSPDTVNAWRKMHQFSYLQNIDSLLNAAEQQNEASQVTVKAPSSPSFLARLFNSNFLAIILWSLAGLFVAYVLYSLFLRKGMFVRTPKELVREEDAIPEEVNLADDYLAQASAAARNQDFRPAVRFLFLHSIKLLNERAMIEFSKDKTNSHYVKEMPPDKRNDFAALVLNYEYVWFGHVTPTEGQYASIEAKFKQFNLKLPRFV